MTTATNRRWTDEKMELAMGRLLRAGVVLAAAVVILGGVMHLWQSKGATPQEYHVFHGTAKALRHPGTILQGVAHGDGTSVIQLGLLLLVATPVARVIFAVAGFLVERDWMYTVVSAVVLGILVYGLVRGG